MLHLAAYPDEPHAVITIANKEGIPRKFLEGIMTDLKKGGLLKSTRGNQGGYRLQRPPDAITFSQILQVIDGPLALMGCLDPTASRTCRDCIDKSTCLVRRVIGVAHNQVSDVLEQATLGSAHAAPEFEHR